MPIPLLVIVVGQVDMLTELCLLSRKASDEVEFLLRFMLLQLVGAVEAFVLALVAPELLRPLFSVDSTDDEDKLLCCATQ